MNAMSVLRTKSIERHPMKFAAALLLSSLLPLSMFPQAARAQVIVAEDFLYSQPTKAFGAGGGFTRQDYAGGQHGALGQWVGLWNSFGDGVITGTDLSEEIFTLETDMFSGVTRNGLSDNWLDRDFQLTGLDDEQTLFFGITMRSDNELAQPNSTFTINDGGGPAQIGMGFSEGGFRALLGNPEETGDLEVVPGPEVTEGLDPHRLVGKLELNVSGNDERLTVWLNPTDVETAEMMAQVEADVVSGLSDFEGNLRLDHVGSGGLMFWDDLALGTTWESVVTVEVPRVTLLADNDSREVQFRNETGSDLEAIFFQLESEAGLFDTRWESLADQGLGGFQENSPNTNRITESSFEGALDFQDGDSFSWGRVFRNRTTEDLIAHVGTTDGLLNLANVVYGPIPEDPTPTVDTDFDDNGVVDVVDMDSLCTQVAAATNLADFDLTGDGAVNSDDVAEFLGQAGALSGDTDLDGAVTFADFLALSANFGLSERAWSDGDFDCSGDVGFPDFLAQSANFGDSAQASAVPEPGANGLGLLTCCGLACSRRRRK